MPSATLAASMDVGGGGRRWDSRVYPGGTRRNAVVHPFGVDNNGPHDDEHSKDRVPANAQETTTRTVGTEIQGAWLKINIVG